MNPGKQTTPDPSKDSSNDDNEVDNGNVLKLLNELRKELYLKMAE
jgi:hypothetical protein